MAQAQKTFEPEECTGQGDHALCSHLLANLLPRSQLRKDFMLFNDFGVMSSNVAKTINRCIYILTGSQAEFLTLPRYYDKLKVPIDIQTPDYDLMTQVGCISEHKVLDTLPGNCSTFDRRKATNALESLFDNKLLGTHLIMVTSKDIRSGYCLICTGQSYKEQEGQENKLVFYTHRSIMELFDPDESLHKAAATRDLGVSFDEVPCFVCDFWPDDVTEFFSRTFNEWPSTDTLDQCKEHCKLLIVKKAHPQTEKHSDIEFRYSFSLLEVMLSRSLPDEARYVYLTVKYICKVTALAQTQLQTYFLKTTFFWIASKENISKWKYSNMRTNTIMILHELHHAFQTQELPNFFLPNSNLLDSLTSTECSEIADGLAVVKQNLCKHVLEIHSTYEVKQTDHDYDDLHYLHAYTLFAKYVYSKGTDNVLACSIRQTFEEALLISPDRLDCLIDYADFQWNQKDKAAAYVSWLNALIICTSYDCTDFSRCGFSLFTTYDMFRLDAVQQPLLFKNQEDLSLPADVVAVYHLVTKQRIPRESADYLVTKLSTDTTVDRYSERWGSLPSALRDKLPTMLLDVQYLLQVCAHVKDIEDENPFKSIEWMQKKNQPEASQATVGSSEEGATPNEHESARNRWQEIVDFFAQYTCLSKVELQGIEEAYEKRRTVIKYMTSLVSLFFYTDNPDTVVHARYTCGGLAQMDDGSEQLVELLEDAFSESTNEKANRRLTAIVEDGLKRKQSLQGAAESS